MQRRRRWSLAESRIAALLACSIERRSAPHWRSCFTKSLGLRFLCDLSRAEIGTRIGISQMQVSRLLRRALEQVDRPDRAHHGDKPDGQNRRRRVFAA
jgi:hypothetical protein